mmetsp:Transcript_40698/g.105297  ORF Transcript_40698/g.105297 Transcript_40698/m.105297 type:complete len:206 (+) Transcript_40698:643-1260(+)
MVEGNDFIALAVHDEHRAGQLLHLPVVWVEVEAVPDAGRPTAAVWLRVNNLDARKQWGVEDDPAQLTLGRQPRHRATANTLPIGDDPLWGYPLAHEHVIGSLEVRTSVRGAWLSGRRAIATIFHAHYLNAQHLSKLVVGTHHHADVCGIAVAVQQNQGWLRWCWRWILVIRHLFCRSATQPHYRDSAPFPRGYPSNLGRLCRLSI